MVQGKVSTRTASLLLAVVCLPLAACEEGGPAQGEPSTPAAGLTKQAEPPAPPPTEPIARRIWEQAQKLAQGMHPADEVLRGTLDRGARQDFQLILRSDRCHKIFGAGSPTVVDLDLLLFDQNGAQVTQDTANDPVPALGIMDALCPATPGAYRLQVRMRSGEGSFGVQVFESPP